MTANTPPSGPELTLGVPAADIPDGALLAGHVGGEPVLLARVGGVLRAVDALCTHYHAPLADGLVVGETLRCPWHHASFCLKTGEAIGAPAIDPLACWNVDETDGRVTVSGRATPAPAIAPHRRPAAPRRVVIVGGGAAGFAAAELLRREGFDGDVTLVSDDADPPYDRPNCSKDFLAGTAPRDWMPLRPAAFYAAQSIDLRTGVKVNAFDPASRRVFLDNGAELEFDALILATGAEPVRPPLPGFDSDRVLFLRSLADAEAIIAATAGARRVAVVGASFIGLEVAAALIVRGLAVSVVAPETIPLARILGPDVGAFLRSLHEAHGVTFHLGRTVTGFRDGRLGLDDGSAVEADLVVVGVGVRPRIGLANAAGLAVDKGVVVDGHFRTDATGVYAAGDVALYPDARTGERIRVEHWAAAARQGQHVARVLLGQAGVFTDPPFFWSAHYDLTISYVGHAAAFDAAVVDGSIPAGDAAVRYFSEGRLMALATIGRDRQSLEIEQLFESEGGTGSSAGG